MLATVHRKLTQGLPNRTREQWAKVLRARYRGRLKDLSPLTQVTPVNLDVHMLCGARAWDMGIWASWSLLRFLPQTQLWVHSDGTLTSDHIEHWKRVIPAANTTTPDERAARAGAALAPLPRLLEWRQKNWASCQLVDMHLYGNSRWLLSMDSDVLCFQRPVELIAALDDSVPRWNRDLGGKSFYIADTQSLRAATGHEPKPALNAGFLLVPRFDEATFAEVDRIISQLQAQEMGLHHDHAAQTIYGCLFGRTAGTPFSPLYEVREGATDDSVIVRHFPTMREVRPRYFTEGIPALARQMIEKAAQ